MVHLDHLRLNVEEHAIDIVQILLCERGEDEESAGVVQNDVAFIAEG